MIVMGNRLEFVASYLGILRAQAVAVPVNPTATAGELARMIADSGSRIVLADADAVTEVRGAVAALDEAMAGDHPAGSIEADLFSRLVRPRVVVVGATLQPDERSYDHLRAERAHADPAAPGPGEAGGAALHQRHVRAPARRDAHAPGAARQHRPGRLGRPADDPRRRRGAGRAADVPRLRPQRRPRRRAPPPGQARARRAVRPAGHPGPDRGRGVQRHPGRAAGVRLLARHRRPARAARSGAADALRARRRCRRS